MKRILSLVLMLMFVLSSCAIANAEVSAEQSGEITIWVWGDYEQKGAMDFNDYYPNIQVNYVYIPQDEYTTKLQTAITSGLELPDIVCLEMTPRAMELSYDVWEKLDAEPYNLDKSELVDFCLPLISNSNGDICCVQIDNCVGGYVYNREMAKKYLGTDDPEELEALLPDLASVVELGKRVSEESGGQDYLYSGVDDAFMAAFGLYNQDAMVTDGKLTVDSSFGPAYEFCADLVAANAVNMYMQWTPAWNAAFAQNN
ncbi:MAG: ABC transporter substrate-binding protein, partial [Clostridia bacterium]|nr:ABC transporter substrate-binding protein [Clostridia bacterium]